MIKTLLILTLFPILCSTKNIVQETNTIEHSNQQWVQYYNRLKLSAKYTLVSDASVRWKNNLNNYSLSLLRAGITYNFNKSHSVSTGIASILSYSKKEISKIELRGWQESLSCHQIKRFYFSNRIRLEERYFKSLVGNKFNINHNFNYRIRYRFYVSIPLNNNSIKEKTIYINMGDELFINFGKEIIHNTFDNNRIIGGLGYQLNKKLSINLNYVNQFTQGKTSGNFEESDLLWLSITHYLSLNNNLLQE